LLLLFPAPSCRPGKATLFINHEKKQTDKLKLLPAFYD
jgi:hypothetical protein